MNRLTFDSPQEHEQIMMNLAYVGEDECLHIREMELDFTQYIKKQCHRRGCNISNVEEYEMYDAMEECISDDPECPVFLLYMVAAQAATLRELLKQYEDTGLTPEEIEQIICEKEISLDAKYAIDKYGDELIKRLDALNKSIDAKSKLRK